MGNNKIYFKNLDSIRFIAALLVYLEHGISPSYQYLPIKNTFWEKLLNIIRNDAADVSVFFVLSGFLITFLLINEHELNSKNRFAEFLYSSRSPQLAPLFCSAAVFFFNLSAHCFLDGN